MVVSASIAFEEMGLMNKSGNEDIRRNGKDSYEGYTNNCCTRHMLFIRGAYFEHQLGHKSFEIAAAQDSLPISVAEKNRMDTVKDNMSVDCDIRCERPRKEKGLVWVLSYCHVLKDPTYVLYRKQSVRSTQRMAHVKSREYLLA